jgi:hypothetical protein
MDIKLKLNNHIPVFKLEWEQNLMLNLIRNRTTFFSLIIDTTKTRIYHGFNTNCTQNT